VGEAQTHPVDLGASFATAHAVHAAVLGAPLVVLGLLVAHDARARAASAREAARDLTARGDLAPRARRGPVEPGGRVLRVVVALTLVVAAAVHTSVISEHFAESRLFGVFFVVCAVAQGLAAALVLVAPGRLWLWPVLLGNVGLVLTWLMSRTVGVPVGPEAWSAESVGAPDVLATTAEIVAVAACLLLARARSRPAGARAG
jgi:hypothetical protein